MQFTQASLVRLLDDIGFTCVVECHTPLEPCKPDNRITLAALKGTRVKLSAYPWVNDQSEDAIAATIQALEQARPVPRPGGLRAVARTLLTTVNRLLRPLGCELRRV